jgi:predicted acetyltransferase
MSKSTFRLVKPGQKYLSSYRSALERGWSPNNVRDVSAEHLDAIRADPDAFLRDLIAQTGTIPLPDGRHVPKLPSVMQWMWDGDFCGTISLRWQPDSDTLPDYVLGHVGYAVVPWKRGNGYAARALGTMVREARRIGLRRIELTTDKTNTASRRTIERNGGACVGEVVNPTYGLEPKALYVIDLTGGSALDTKRRIKRA